MFVDHHIEILCDRSDFHDTADQEQSLGQSSLMVQIARGSELDIQRFRRIDWIRMEEPLRTVFAIQMVCVADALDRPIFKMFAGSGIPVARALAADAQQLTELIKKPELIAALGAANREEMLKKLGIGVGADVARTEKSVLQFALCVLKMSTVETSQLPPYILAVRQVGATVPWASLAGRPTTAAPAKPTRRAGAFGEEGTQDGRPNKPY